MPEIKKDDKTQKDVKTTNSTTNSTDKQTTEVSTGTVNTSVTSNPELSKYERFSDQNGNYIKVGLLRGLQLTTTFTAGLGGGPGYPGGPWADCVKKMAEWYQTNIHSYGSIYSPCPLINNQQVRHDCTGFVRACLQLFGCDPGEIRSLIMTPGSSFDKTLQANGFALVQNGPYVISQTAQPWDICSRTVNAGFGHGHAEIFAGEFDGRFKSWGWGSVHDLSHGGMPSGINRGERYEFIWRKT